VAAGKAANMKVIGVMTGQGGKTPKNADLLVENIEKGFSEIVKMIRGE
jgi:beta-phosphoglucomutase-like phosphatase (HAD superfamily)